MDILAEVLDRVRGERHLIYSDRRTEPLPILEIDRLPQQLGVVRHGDRAAQRLDEGTGQAVFSGKKSRRESATKRKSGKR